MNILDSAKMYNSQLKDPVTELNKLEIMASVDPEFRDKVTSKRFVRIRVETNKLASPLNPRELSLDGPIVVDINASKDGRVGKFVPKAIVVSGHKLFAQACAQRLPRITVWIGELAAKALDIKADHELGSEELRQKLQEQVTLRVAPKTTPFRGMGTMNETPWVREVYPYEGYFIYDYRAKSFKQLFDIDNVKRTVSLVGTAQEVKQEFVPVKMGSRLDAAIEMYAHCGDVQAHDQEACAMKAGVKYSMGEVVKAFSLAKRKGYKTKDIEAKSPPGWSGTVKKMKDHPEIDNPFALAWWMEEEGYEPHTEEE